MPVVELDYEQIGKEIHFRRQIVEQCIHETLLFFAGALQDQKEVEFSFAGIGLLAVRKNELSMTFFEECLLELDATGNMLAALLRDSKMMRLVAFPGKNNFSRFRRDEVITLPRLALEKESSAAVSLKPRRELAPWGGGSRKLSVMDPVYMARRRVALSRRTTMKAAAMENVKEATRVRFLPVIHSKRQEEPKQPRPPSQPRVQLPPCDQQLSGTEMSSTHMKRADKQLKLLMAAKRQELEAEAWRQYRANRMGHNAEPSQSPCPHLFEDPQQPPHLLRKAYAEKMKGRLPERDSGQRPARHGAPNGQAELHLPRIAQKGEKMKVLEVRGRAMGLPATS
ncbi:coiled-coil domain-containing protein 81-like [Pogoniulus pusillus]|uniref:coiled-coil domain-containing protein 81-like n=1 Tax=Pogoniulus pusillus TaxID=488313 RepID=UPI0030B93C84